MNYSKIVHICKNCLSCQICNKEITLNGDCNFCKEEKATKINPSKDIKCDSLDCNSKLEDLHKDCKKCASCQKIVNVGICVACKKLIYSKNIEYPESLNKEIKK